MFLKRLLVTAGILTLVAGIPIELIGLLDPGLYAISGLIVIKEGVVCRLGAQGLLVYF